VANEPTDAQIHARILAGDADALAVWQDRTRPAIVSYAEKHGATPEEAEEMWNDVFLATWKRALREPPIDPPGEGLRRYAFRVAMNRVARRYEQRNRQVPTTRLSDRDMELPALADARDERLSPLIIALRQCLERADERIRKAYELSLQEAPDSEIAEVLGIRPASVRPTLWRADRHMRKCIEEQTNV
jgi:RNA polymerase sigma-70 factor, ECF subfamily